MVERRDDRAVLLAAPWAHARLRLMRIGADKSAVGTVNRPLQADDTYFVYSKSCSFGSWWEGGKWVRDLCDSGAMSPAATGKIFCRLCAGNATCATPAKEMRAEVLPLPVRDYCSHSL